MKHWSQMQPAAPCRWPVLREGRERACGQKAQNGRCSKHVDRRPLIEQTLDPLGPYVAAVERIQKRLKSWNPRPIRPA